MIRHRWQNNTCIYCGLTRDRREFQKLVNTRSVLSQHGVWIDVPMYQYGIGWWYGELNKFIRPECKGNSLLTEKTIG